MLGKNENFAAPGVPEKPGIRPQIFQLIREKPGIRAAVSEYPKNPKNPAGKKIAEKFGA